MYKLMKLSRYIDYDKVEYIMCLTDEQFEYSINVNNKSRSNRIQVSRIL